jgi:hypothetical protein
MYIVEIHRSDEARCHPTTRRSYSTHLSGTYRLSSTCYLLRDGIARPPTLIARCPDFAAIHAVRRYLNVI